MGMREEGGYEKKEFDKMIRKMKQVSDKNQNKPSNHQTSDGGWGPGGRDPVREVRVEEENEWTIEGEGEYETGELPSYPHEGSEEPSHSFYSDEDDTEMEDMRMFEEEEMNDNDVQHDVTISGDTIEMSDCIPEFEPVEITPVSYNDRDDIDSDDEDEFNDVEEITDDMCNVSHEDIAGTQPEIHQIKEERIKVEIEPDINHM